MGIDIKIFNSSDAKSIPRKKMASVAEHVFRGENIIEAELNIIIVDDKEMLEMNTKFLGHDYTTDVITFDLDEEDILAGEIYISVDTAEKQANEYTVSLTNELMRLVAHGALHLAGHDDDTHDKRESMHGLENKYMQI